jgi:putative component of toxin-antitoxin plasmid stabilization module
VARIDRLSMGIFGDCRLWAAAYSNCGSTGGRAIESITRWGKACVLLLAADKRKQVSDIRRALEYLKDYWTLFGG